MEVHKKYGPTYCDCSINLTVFPETTDSDESDEKLREAEAQQDKLEDIRAWQKTLDVSLMSVLDALPGETRHIEGQKLQQSR